MALNSPREPSIETCPSPKQPTLAGETRQAHSSKAWLLRRAGTVESRTQQIHFTHLYNNVCLRESTAPTIGEGRSAPVKRPCKLKKKNRRVCLCARILFSLSLSLSELNWRIWCLPVIRSSELPCPRTTLSTLSHLTRLSCSRHNER